MPDDGIGALNLPIEVLIGVAVLAVLLLAMAVIVVARAGKPIIWVPALIISWMMAFAVVSSWWSEASIGLQNVLVWTTCAVTIFVIGTYKVFDTLEDRL